MVFIGIYVHALLEFIYPFSVLVSSMEVNTYCLCFAGVLQENLRVLEKREMLVSS